MRDIPRHLPPRTPQADHFEKVVTGLGCAALIGGLVFWLLIIYVVAHFVIKYW